MFDLLRRHHAALCIHDLLADHPFELTTDWTYVRFHGPDALRQPYHGSYSAGCLDRWASRLAGVLDADHDVYAYFNNDWFGHAVRDATCLAPGLDRRPTSGRAHPLSDLAEVRASVGVTQRRSLAVVRDALDPVPRRVEG